VSVAGRVVADTRNALTLPRSGVSARSIQTQFIIKVEEGIQWLTWLKKHSISSELAEKMVNAAVAKAKELGVSENVAILDDGGNLRPLAGWMGPRIPTIEIAQNKGVTALFGVSRRSFSTLSMTDPCFWPASPRAAVLQHGVEDFPFKVDGEVSAPIG